MKAYKDLLYDKEKGWRFLKGVVSSENAIVLSGHLQEMVLRHFYDLDKNASIRYNKKNSGR